jgi:ankyrin repeat protein
MSESNPHTSRLPAEPNLRHLKDQAKDLLRSGGAPSLGAALFQIANLYGFPSWPRLKKYVEDQTNTGKLKHAIDHDDIDEVVTLLSRHPELRTARIGYGGDGPLTWAAECRGIGQPSQARLNLVEWLISSGSDVHEGGDAPLMRASLDGSRTSMMDLLVRFGADVNAAWRGSYPIIFAPCETLDPTSLEWLLQHGADPNCGDEATWQSKGRSHPGTALDYLLGTYIRNKEALDVSISLLQEAGGRTQYDALGVLATIRGDLESLAELLQDSPSVIETRYPSLNIGTTAGRMLTLKGATLLHVAAEFGQAEVAKRLLAAGADVNAPALIDSEGLGGQTPIFHAATQNRNLGIELVRFFLSRGADLNVRCRIPGHYEIPEDKVFEGTVMEYARRFPGTENRALEELRRSEHGH